MGFFSIFRGIKKLIFFTLLALIVYVAYKISPSSFKGIIPSSTSEEKLTVKRVVDGDTFVMSNNDRIRLIGIDTPEKFQSSKLEKDVERSGKDKKAIQELGKSASEYVRNLVEGKTVTLKSDSKNSDKDKYNRLLRYVYLEDGTCINAKIIEDGYANAYLKFPFEKADEFKKLEKEARAKNRGLWKMGM
jgi:micrococcal nuclease